MIRNYSVRVDVIRNGARLTSLHPVGTLMVDCQAESEIKTSLGGQFLSNDDVNWLTDELVPYQVIDGTEYPVGVFHIGTVQDHYDENGVKTVRVEAYDRCLVLKQAKTETIKHFSAGANYVQTIERLLLEAGIYLYLSTPSGETLATDREDWEIGTPYLTIINDLLKEINYGTIWFNPYGYAMIQPAKKPSAANIDHYYSTDQDVRILQRPCSVETDAFDAGNVFVVICDNPDLEETLIATSVNDNPLSSLSTLKRGRRIVKVSRVDNIPNQTALEDYAQRICMDSMLASEEVSISTMNLPLHGVFDTVAVNHPDVEGIFQEVSWSLILAPGQTMLHKLRRSILI